MLPSARGSVWALRCTDRQISAPHSFAAAGPRGDRRILVGFAEQAGDGAPAVQLGGEGHRELPRGVGLADPAGPDRARVLRTVAGVDRDPRALERRVHPAERLGLPEHGARPGVDRSRADPFELVQRLGADDPVLPHGDVPLELAHGAVAAFAEDAVLASRVEPERVQPALQGADVVAPQHRHAQVQDPVAEPVAGLDELVPRLRAHAAVDQQPAALLERAHGRLGLRAELALELGRRRCARPATRGAAGRRGRPHRGRRA